MELHFWVTHDKAVPAIWNYLALKSVPLPVPKGSLISNPLKPLI